MIGVTLDQVKLLLKLNIRPCKYGGYAGTFANNNLHNHHTPTPHP